MTKKRYLLTFTSLFLFLLYILTSCNDKTPKRNTSIAPNATLNLALRNGIYADVIEKCIPAFEAEYNVECNVLRLAEDELHSLVLKDSKNEEGTYDFCMVDSSWMAEYTAKKVLTNLTSLGYSLDNDIIPATAAACYYDYDLYLAPYGGNVSVLLYNKLMIKEAGYSAEDIVSIEDMLEICKFQKKRHNLGFMYRGDTENNIVVDFLPFLCSYGGWVVDSEYNPTINTIEFKRAMETYMEFVATGKAAKKDDLIAAIANKAAVMGIGWPGWYTPTKNSSMDYLALTGKATGNSLSHNANIYGIWTIGIPENSKNKNYAIKLLAYLMEPELQKSTVNIGGVPCRYSSLTDKETLIKFPQYAVVCKALENGVYRPVMQEWSTFYTVLGEEMRLIITGQKDIETGLKDAQIKLDFLQLR